MFSDWVDFFFFLFCLLESLPSFSCWKFQHYSKFESNKTTEFLIHWFVYLSICPLIHSFISFCLFLERIMMITRWALSFSIAEKKLINILPWCMEGTNICSLLIWTTPKHHRNIDPMVSAKQLQCPWFYPDFGVLSVWNFRCSSLVCLDLLVLLPPSFQKHAGRCIGHAKFNLYGLNWIFN